MANSKQRRQERTAKELLLLGRDAKQVRQNALTMEEQVRAQAILVGELRTQVSQLEIDRDAWKERAVATQGERDTLVKHAAKENARILSLERERVAWVETAGKANERVAELEGGLADLPKLRKRLRDRAVEIADLQKENQGLKALLKRHEHAAGVADAMIAGAKAGT